MFGGQIATFIAGITLMVYALGALADKELAGRIAGESDPRKDKKWNSTRSC